MHDSDLVFLQETLKAKHQDECIMIAGFICLVGEALEIIEQAQEYRRLMREGLYSHD